MKNIKHLLRIIGEKVMPLVVVADEKFWKAENPRKMVHVYKVYDNEEYEFNELTKEEHELLMEFCEEYK